jgi:glycosyltransferase involved in cell wall biosynthesis
MKISFGTRIASDTITGKNGYGYATQMMLASLNRLGYQVSDNDSSADVEIWFDQPQNWKIDPDKYTIGYHPWESTKLKDGWVEIMNQCDEIWTPSPLIAQWYVEDGITVPIYVYEHGIDHFWQPVKREPEHTIKFLHVGAEASRKGGWDVRREFKRAFPNRTDVRLTMKMVDSPWINIDTPRVRVINKNYNLRQMRMLFYTHDVYVYPSWGEGFGLTPLQALATGMPTICTEAWAPYARFLDPKLALDSELKNHAWGGVHPGKMFRPDFDQLIDHMRYVVNNYDEARDSAASQALDVHRAYDWDLLTKDAFSALEERLKK